MSIGATIQFHGAAGEVTGSCTLLTTPKARILVDFGMFQGTPADEARNAVAPRIDFASLDAIIITHAHIDHCGRLAMATSLGFKGKIYCTIATHELLGRVMRSSARLQRARFYERSSGSAPWSRALMPGEAPGVAPEFPPAQRLFDTPEVRDTMDIIEGVALNREVKIAPLMSLTFRNAGHIPGAASAEISIGVGADRKIVLFSGDLGPTHSALLASPHKPARADVVIVESTNGERRRDAGADPEAKLAEIVADAAARKAKIIIPCFALGRAQLLVHRLARLHGRGLLHGLNVYVDSPMAVHGIESLYRNPEYLSPELEQSVRAGGAPLWFPELHYVLSKRESMAIDRMVHGGIILAGSGFMDAGPVMRHLGESIDRTDCIVVLSGYQPDGGFAWKLQRGADRVQIDGKLLPVRASTVRVEGLSGHADQDDLVKWLGSFGEKPGRVLINHGTDAGRAALAARLSTELGIECAMPAYEVPIEL
ncbi:MAG: MBL fold metallo-hydrolase [Planctomycetota bacterium]|nr:MAG: MBL fold metallo-hydrolase [Planctomycetota bacterium]